MIMWYVVETERTKQHISPQSYNQTSLLQQSPLFNLPKDILVLICEYLAVKNEAIGCPDREREVRPGHFLEDFRRYRSLDFAKTSRTANKLITHLFLALNTFEFHYMRDLEVFAFFSSDDQRKHISKVRLYVSATLPFALPNPLTSMRVFPAVSSDDIKSSAESFKNALVLTRSFSRLVTLDIFYRCQIHSDWIIHPNATAYSRPWPSCYQCHPIDAGDHLVATWDIRLIGALEFLRSDATAEDKETKTCHFDFDHISTNELARKIDLDKAADPEIYKNPSHLVKADCADIVRLLRAAKDKQGCCSAGAAVAGCCFCSTCQKCGKTLSCQSLSRPWTRMKRVFCWYCGACVVRFPAVTQPTYEIFTTPRTLA